MNANPLERHNANPNVFAKDGNTPLHDAAEDGQVEIVASLLEYGANAEVNWAYHH